MWGYGASGCPKLDFYDGFRGLIPQQQQGPAERVSTGPFYMSTAACPSRKGGRLTTEIVKS